ncbi:MAG: aldo/keto reductase [Candidatus Microbacterium phytovorans]|uniref:Aldo/keto reductase n=1 Tax=Candidatus Microbacterium phytovorans TaxID=3121374 RepID=A0AAJ6B2A0_9MICO|nr:aldo/keto reductase [Microbacterium sp.]WEK12963.1 MAG: aldo/keto reductase [Microbacterium sp.]
MENRTLGRQGLQTSALGYGAMRIAFESVESDARSIAAIRRAHDDGVTHFDTARLYGWGRGEQLLGAAIAPFRDEVTIATKFGYEPGFVPDSSPELIRKVVDESLRFLGLDHIDLLYQHRHDPKVPVEDVVGVMKEFVDAGKVSYLGLSNTRPDLVRRAHAVHPITALQTEYSVFARKSEEFFPVLEELGIGLVAYAPLARGFLTGGVTPVDQFPPDDFRRRSPLWAPGNYEKNVEIVGRLTEMGKRHDASLSQIALAWLLARRPYIVPIPGSSDADRVSQNLGATGVHLTPEELAFIDDVTPAGA